MKLMKVTSVVMLLAMLSLAGSANAELLLNRSFDDLDGGTGNPTSASWGTWNWDPSGGSAGAAVLLDGAPDPANSGPAYAEIWAWAGGSGGFYQGGLAPVVGEVYELSIWARDQGWGDDKNLSVTLHVDDGSGMSLLVNEMLYSGAGLGDSDYHKFSVLTPAIPAGTIAAEFGFTFAGSGTFALDDASMAVPEPMTLGLLGLGGLFLRRRRA